MSRYIERTALGRNAQLGALYDARTDTFLSGSNIFTLSLDPSTDVQSIELPRCEIRLDKSDKLDEKYTLLKVDANLKLSVLSNMVSHFSLLM